MIRKVVHNLVAAGILAVTTSSYALSQEPQLVKILNERALWGKDWPAALASLPSWNQLGEQTVAVFPHQVVGATLYEDRENTERVTTEFRESMEPLRREVRPEFKDLLEPYLRGQPFPAAVEAVSLPEGRQSARVALVTPSLEFLAPNLTVERVTDLLGQPREVRAVAVQTDSDRRPEILTLHIYAEGGAVAFAQSDLEPSPDLINRVILDVPSTVDSVFR